MRMGQLVGFPQPASTHVSVYLRSRQALVPQQLLDTSQVSTPVKQMRGKRVPQRVW